MNSSSYYIALFFLLLPFSASATHLMGGDVSYKRLDNGKYEITIVVYEDCIATATVGNILNYTVLSGSNLLLAERRTAVRILESLLTENEPACAFDGYCVEINIFKDTIRLGNDPDGYYIHYRACCRNNAISSLTKGSSGQADQGQVWQAHIPPVSIKNSSPVFLTAPIPFLCAGKLSIFNHGVFDPDGDSLVFSLSVPKGSGTPPNYDDVYYSPGYSVNFPFGYNSPEIQIDPITGEITAMSNKLGNFVVAIEVKEYRVDKDTRQSIYLGKIVRDLQFIVVPCNNNPAPVFSADTAGHIKFTDVGDTLCFTVSATDGQNTEPGAAPYDHLTLTATGSMLGNSSPQLLPPFATFPTDSAYKTVSSEFCWVPACHHITITSPHLLTVQVKDRECNIIQRTYSIYVKQRQIFSPPQINCFEVAGKDSIRLSWQLDTPYTDFGKILIYRSANGSDFQHLDSIEDPTISTFIDANIPDLNGNAYYYFIRVENNCGILSLPSDTINSAVLVSALINNSTVNAEAAIELKLPVPTNNNIVGYRLYRAVDTGEFNFFANISNLQGNEFTFIDKNVNTAENSYFYNLKYVDSCGNIGEAGDIHSPVLLKGKIGYRHNYLSWINYVGYETSVVKLERLRDADWIEIAAFSSGENEFKDEDVECNVTYLYRIKSIKLNSTEVSYSNVVSLNLVALSDLNPVEIKFATVAEPNNVVQLKWETGNNPDVERYHIYRKKAEEKRFSLTRILDLEEPEYLDTIDVLGSPCYYIIAEDFCGGLSRVGNLACPIVLNGKNGKLVNHLEWNAYSEWPQGVKDYFIYKSEDHSNWIEIGLVQGDVVNFTDAFLTDEVKDYCYRVKGVEKGGAASETYSTVLCLHQEPVVYIPNSFTPGITPGINDGFAPGGMHIASYEMSIFNRWGGLVYKTSQSRPWSGSDSKGQAVVSGSYVYLIRVHSYNGKNYNYSGVVTILE